MSSGVIYGLVSSMSFATKIAKAAALHHLRVHNFDKSAPLVNYAKQECPCLVILDGDSREAEAYDVLKAFAWDVDLKKIPTVGYVSQSKRALKGEMERAGCLKVYLKTEFFKILNDLILRYAK